MPPKKKTNITTKINIRSIAISWLLHSIKILLGDEGIREYIIVHYYPNFKNKTKSDKIRTFNAFIENTREDKLAEIEKYLNTIVKSKKDIIVFTASNVQRNKDDIETHYQSFIVDKTTKNLYIIDPAFDKRNTNPVDPKQIYMGIYYAEITHELIKPFFEHQQYTINYIRLTNPAQTSETDVYCQSWSLLILLQLLNQSKYKNSKNTEYGMPTDELDRLAIILDFYKKIFTDMPELNNNLIAEYEGSINDASFTIIDVNMKKNLLEFNPVDLLMSMTKEDMQQL